MQRIAMNRDSLRWNWGGQKIARRTKGGQKSVNFASDKARRSGIEFPRRPLTHVYVQLNIANIAKNQFWPKFFRHHMPCIFSIRARRRGLNRIRHAQPWPPCHRLQPHVYSPGELPGYVAWILLWSKPCFWIGYWKGVKLLYHRLPRQAERGAEWGIGIHGTLIYNLCFSKRKILLNDEFQVCEFLVVEKVFAPLGYLLFWPRQASKWR